MDAARIPDTEQLSDRKEAILQAVVEEYMSTARPLRFDNGYTPQMSYRL